jgi:4-diphosphocytidyl-2-C-methyl-D-erythritol kinase
LIDALRGGNFASARAAMINRLQPAAEQISPEAARLARELDILDVWGSQMSGSGSSYFALCRSPRHARSVAARLRARNLGVVLTAVTENG